MIVPDAVRKCVAFIGARKHDGSYQLLGSGFFLGRDDGDKLLYVHFVTARHVIEGIKKLLVDEVFIRMNPRDGDAVWLQCEVSDWVFHPTDKSVDVAVIAFGIPNSLDHLALSLSLGATDEEFTKQEIGLGDEVFITGLFRHFYGSGRNIPIVRVGNIACLGEEKVQSSALGEIDAYLVEARSTGGLSGSPVFVNLGIVRKIGGRVMRATGSSSLFRLIGLVHGHYDVSTTDIDSTEADTQKELTVERVNTGIAIVVPFKKIMEVLEYAESKEK